MDGLRALLALLALVAGLYGVATLIKPFWLVRRRWQGALVILGAIVLVVVATPGSPRRPEGLSDAEWADRLLVCNEARVGSNCPTNPDLLNAARRLVAERRAQQEARATNATTAPARSDPGRERTWIAVTQDAVRAKMRDPQSVRFRNLFFHRGVGGAPMVCGEVNARNGFGGYSGYQRFFASGDLIGPITAEQMRPGEFERAWAQNCEN